MLIALELVGFKSFADRTRFDFPDGITVVVGPNGSGKSNVVDAIKWVLGAQSAKALRGKDMIDVIFKGSSAGGRKASNSAEATLVFDNSGGHLPVDAQEVQVTRRVYRSGEGEYLINGSACRLKDIKSLFRGTGVGVDAYSLIEQGKVDRMLQASPKDRRVIFEEAAGISRFNAKKAEAARRLVRVDQNMTRLKDIVDEVHTRLSRLKGQATKAQRYREMTARLSELRLRLGWTEYSQLLEKTQACEDKLRQLAAEVAAFDSQLAGAKTTAQQSEMELHSVAAQCQSVEGRLQEGLQRIAVSRNQQASLWQRIEDNREEQQRQSARLAVLRDRAETLQEELTQIESGARLAQDAYDASKLRADTAVVRAEEIRVDLSQRGRLQEALRKQHVDLLRGVSDKSASVAQQKNLFNDLAQSIVATEQRLTQNKAAEQDARKTAQRAADRLGAIHAQTDASAQELKKAQEDLAGNQARLAALQEQAAILQGRLQGANERLDILEELERHLEGVDSGARHVLELVAQSTDPVFQTVRGLVADLLSVDAELAPQIDTALGHSANALVLSDGQLFQTVRAGQLEVPGRLSLMRLDRLPSRRYGEKVQLDGVRGVIGRADRLIRCEADVEPLFRYLLGTTWLVESLDTALELAHFRGASLRFVTSQCQLIDADGTLTIGALQTSSGLVSRKSEIQRARQEIADCREKFQHAQGEITRAAGRIEKLTPVVQEMEARAKKLAQEFAHQQASAQNAVSRLDEIEAQANQVQSELSQLVAKRQGIEPAIQALTAEVESSQNEIKRIESELEVHDEVIRNGNPRLAAAAEEETLAKIDLARDEQKLESVSVALQQAVRSSKERTQAVVEAEQEMTRLRAKYSQAELQILQLTSLLSEEYIASEAEETSLEGLAQQASVLRKNRSAAVKHLDTVTRSLDKLSAAEQASQLELERSQESASLLLKRYTEDYQIDYDTLAQAELIEDADELQKMDSEASQLRQGITGVGEINMAALAELDELQQRYDYLHGQYEDLMAAKESLQRIIHKINADSRKMFLETLEIIRTNFQKLYRKSFGGGSADIILEEGEDVLECGIDIIATPPGKTALSNSLLSGGEKALTAVALLLAIFQYRPSPFCVLDEVDAPFDEANIGRFVSVLTEFLDWTKFIIVTHSKKTMTASTTLYGVTMQESGVSKQVAVRFEDVNEKGEIIKQKPSGRRAA